MGLFESHSGHEVIKVLSGDLGVAFPIHSLDETPYFLSLNIMYSIALQHILDTFASNCSRTTAEKLEDTLRVEIIRTLQCGVNIC